MNSESVNPEDSTSPAALPSVFPLKENGKSTGQWTLSIQPSHLSLSDAPGAQPYAILREQFKKEVTFMEGMRALAVSQPRKIIFKLDPEAAAALADWLGKPFLAAFYMKRRYAWLMPWAIVWVMLTLMILLPAPQGSPKVPFDIVSFVLGFVLLISCGFARWRPHPVLFLVDGIWFGAVAIQWSIRIVFHERSSGWLVFVALLAWMSVTGFRHFFRFRGVKIQPLGK